MREKLLSIDPGIARRRAHPARASDRSSSRLTEKDLEQSGYERDPVAFVIPMEGETRCLLDEKENFGEPM